MTSKWLEPAGGIWGGLKTWVPDVLTSATPLWILHEGGSQRILPLLLGNTAGSLGETCAVLIVIGAVILIATKSANFRIILSGLISFAALQTVFWLTGIPQAVDPLRALLSGSVLYGMIFMATDPVSASQTTNGGRWIYGSIIGFLTVLIRLFSSWPEGITFAILFANMFAPLLDHIMKSRKKREAAA
jgi:Na+-transporting NADH:ubiquinone oxidoreductase subunit B